MSNPLVVVVELDGFQHGPVELTPKCLCGMQRPTTGLLVVFPDRVFGPSTQGIPVHLLSSIDIWPWPTANGPRSAAGVFP